METGSFIIKDLTGEWPVYPGHPLVLATAIMEVFADYEAANTPTDHNSSAALGDNRIPGAGDHVGAAMRVLGLGDEGASAEAMIAAANNYWDSGRAGGHVNKVEAGRVQAENIRPHFEKLAQRWFVRANATADGGQVFKSAS